MRPEENTNTPNELDDKSPLDSLNKFEAMELELKISIIVAIAFGIIMNLLMASGQTVKNFLNLF